jgi:Na+/H+-dicarboxylate symporter
VFVRTAATVRIPFHWFIVLALVAAVPVGLAVGTDTVWLGVRPLAVFDFLGTFFLRALQMLVVPLIVAAVINAVSGAGQDLGRLGARTVIYFLTSSLLAVLTGLVLVNLTTPGIVDGQPARDLIGLTASVESLAGIESRGGGDLWGIFLRMVPSNVVQAAASADMLALITFSVLYGLLIPRLPARSREVQRDFWQGVYDLMIAMTAWVMWLAPVGVFALVARALASAGFGAFGPLLGFFFTVLGGLALHMFITLPVLLFVFARVNPVAHMKAMGEALLMAFTTSSSSATLPKTLDCLETKAGVPRRIAGFVAPLGATVNMDGTALYECVAAMFIAQAYGLELGFGVQFTIVTVALLSSIGVAGIPSASLVAIAVILTTIGLPIEGLGLILAVDRVLDMCRTTVNVYSDSIGATIVANTETRQAA